MAGHRTSIWHSTQLSRLCMSESQEEKARFIYKWKWSSDKALRLRNRLHLNTVSYEVGRKPSREEERRETGSVLASTGAPGELLALRLHGVIRLHSPLWLQHRSMPRPFTDGPEHGWVHSQRKVANGSRAVSCWNTQHRPPKGQAALGSHLTLAKRGEYGLRMVIKHIKLCLPGTSVCDLLLLIYPLVSQTRITVKL